MPGPTTPEAKREARRAADMPPELRAKLDEVIKVTAKRMSTEVTAIAEELRSLCYPSDCSGDANLYVEDALRLIKIANDAERARIVAWLRKEAVRDSKRPHQDDWSKAWDRALWYAADAIERGEHLNAETAPRR